MIPAPDGYQYGVRFRDGSVRHSWNGRTQHDHAEKFRDRLREEYPGEAPHFVIVRRLPGGPWEETP